MNIHFGWRKDPYDHRDYLYKTTYREVPQSVILTNYLPDIRDQGNVGSCVGFGIGANLVARAKKLNVYTEWFSPTWIYNGARFIEGSLTQDVGCYPRDALHWLYEKGCLLEHWWHYNPLGLDTTAPPSHLEPEAAKYPLLAYYRVVDGVAGICETLANGQYVSIGTPWFSKWMDPVDGVLGEVSFPDMIVGGHETCLYGYNKDKKIFYGINSWGTDWGNKGLYTMPFSAFDAFKIYGGYDAHYIGYIFAPEPVIEPSECQFSQSVTKTLNAIWKLFGKKTRFAAEIRRGAK